MRMKSLKWLRGQDREQSKVNFSQIFDVLVVGGGNAGLCAALTAQEAGANVLLLESAPKDFRGGNHFYQ